MARRQHAGKSRSLRSAVVITLLIYVGLVVALIQPWKSTPPATAPGASSHAAADPQSSAGHTDSEAAPFEPDPQQARTMIEKLGVDIQNMTEAQQMALMEENLSKLQKVDEQSVHGITRVFEQAMGVKPTGRAFEPSDRAAGRFDIQSSSLYDIRRVEDAKGVRYEYVIVDVAGRTLRYEVPEDQMTAEDLRAHRVFEQAAKYPKLRILVDAVRRYADSESRE